MNYEFFQSSDASLISLAIGQLGFSRGTVRLGRDRRLYTIAWNKGPEQAVIIDEMEYRFPAQSILPIMMDQTFRFEQPGQVLGWQFNREFYCIVNHDAEVGCAGFVFYGPSPTMFITLDAEQTNVLDRLLAVFEAEFNTDEDNKVDMLRILLVRLIIRITRLAKKQYMGAEGIQEEKFWLIRHFYLQVEIHFRQAHQVQFYAALLHKSPKTISNIFSLYSQKTPLQVIQERIAAEARRLIYYTDKSMKEIADDLGFEDAAHFSRFFKNCTSQNPSSLRRNVKA